jgi:hypothetical protein
MDPKEIDEAKLQRQALLAQRMGEALDRIAARDRRECPDPEIIAAYSEDSLDSAESSKWEGHFAACSRCRNILRVLAASADSPLAAKEVAQIGELVAAARPAAVERPSVAADRGATPPKVIQWPTRWLAPALAVAAVLAVWFAMRPPWRATDQGTSGTLVAQAPREEVASPPAEPSVIQPPAEIAPQQQPKTESATSADRSRAMSAPRNTPSEPGPERDLQKGLNSRLSPRAGTAAGALPEEKKMDRLADGRQDPSAAPAPVAPPPPSRLAMPSPSAPQSQAKTALSGGAGEAPQVTASANAVENAPAARDKQAADAIQNQTGSTSTSAVQQEQEIVPQVRAGARKEQAFGLARPLQKDSSLLKAPSDLIHWRAGKGGIIQRSPDSGKTWMSQPSPSKEDWLAGAAFSDTVCWLAGRRGAIARTTDGQNWQRIPPPAQAAAADGSQPDWTSISASDAQAAVVTAADGRKFATADGGKTWQPQ